MATTEPERLVLAWDLAAMRRGDKGTMRRRFWKLLDGLTWRRPDDDDMTFLDTLKQTDQVEAVRAALRGRM